MVSALVTPDMSLIFLSLLSSLDWTPSPSDYAAFNPLVSQLLTNVVVKVGLSGLDLTTFLGNCVTVVACDETEFVDYSGWAIVGEFIGSVSLTGVEQGFAF